MIFSCWSCGDEVVVVHFHVERATALGHGGEVGAVGEHLRHGGVGADDGIAGLVLHALDASTAGVHVAHDGSGEFVGNGDFDLHDGLQQGGLGDLHGFFEGDAAGGFEAEFVGIHVVIAAVVEADLEIDDGVSGEEATGGGFEDSLFDGGNEVLGNGPAEDVIDELEVVRRGAEATF